MWRRGIVGYQKLGGQVVMCCAANAWQGIAHPTHPLVTPLWRINIFWEGPRRWLSWFYPVCFHQKIWNEHHFWFPILQCEFNLLHNAYLKLVSYRDSRWMSYEDSKKWVFPCIYPPQILIVYMYRQKMTDQNIVHF